MLSYHFRGITSSPGSPAPPENVLRLRTNGQFSCQTYNSLRTETIVWVSMIHVHVPEHRLYKVRKAVNGSSLPRLMVWVGGSMSAPHAANSGRTIAATAAAAMRWRTEWVLVFMSCPFVGPDRVDRLRQRWARSDSG